VTRNRQILLVARPRGEATADNFRLVETDMPALVAGQVLVRHHYLSLDPYMRGRMNAGESYAEPQALGEVMLGGTVGEIVASRSDRYRVGDRVVGMGGWQEYQIVDGDRAGALRRVDGTAIPLSAHLGAVGMPGVTAWYGLLQLIVPRSGETIVVSAASGAVGSVVGQLARLRGCRVVGIAGGPEKCRAVVEEFGFDACIGGARRDEEKARAKERIFSFRDEFGQWDPKNQRPELWDLYNARSFKGENIRVFPISNWTEIDVWQYIEREKLALPAIYFAHRRPIVRRGGGLLPVTEVTPARPGETIETLQVRFRTVGDITCTAPVESTACDVASIIAETAVTTITERGATRLDDQTSEASMEQRKKEGYF